MLVPYICIDALFFTMIGIYAIRNIKNDKRYIGQSIHVNKRFTEHRRELDKGIHFNSHLQSSWNLYGSDNFVFEVLQECDACQLNDCETFWKLHFDPNTYNLGNTGNVNTTSLETREKTSRTINEQMKQMTKEERKRKFGHQKNVGKPKSDETKLKISNTLSGRPSYIRSDKCRIKSSLHNTFRQPIFQYTREGVFIRAWPTITSCIKENPQLDQGAISSCCRLTQKTSKGYTFRYANTLDLHLLELGYIPTLDKFS